MGLSACQRALYAPEPVTRALHSSYEPPFSGRYVFNTHSKNRPLVEAFSNGKVYPPREERYIIHMRPDTDQKPEMPFSFSETRNLQKVIKS